MFPYRAQEDVAAGPGLEEVGHVSIHGSDWLEKGRLSVGLLLSASCQVAGTRVQS